MLHCRKSEADVVVDIQLWRKSVIEDKIHSVLANARTDFLHSATHAISKSAHNEMQQPDF